VASFNRSSGRERPARSTLSLVLHVSNSSLLSPVNRCRKSSGGSLSYVSWDLFGDSSSQVDFAEFLNGEISKFVHSNSEGLVCLVVGVDKVQIALEDVVSLGKFEVIVGLLILVHEHAESSLVFIFAQGEGESEEGS